MIRGVLHKRTKREESINDIILEDSEIILTSEPGDIAESIFLSRASIFEKILLYRRLQPIFISLFISSVPFHMPSLRSLTVRCTPPPLPQPTPTPQTPKIPCRTKMAAPSRTYCSRRLSHPVSRKSRAFIKGLVHFFFDFIFSVCLR